MRDRQLLEIIGFSHDICSVSFLRLSCKQYLLQLYLIFLGVRLFRNCYRNCFVFDCTSVVNVSRRTVSQTTVYHFALNTVRDVATPWYFLFRLSDIPA